MGQLHNDVINPLFLWLHNGQSSSTSSSSPSKSGADWGRGSHCIVGHSRTSAVKKNAAATRDFPDHEPKRPAAAAAAQ